MSGPDRQRPGSIRRRLLAVLAAVALAPALLVAAVSIRTAEQLAGVAANQSRAALAGEVRRQLESQVQAAARTEDVLFERVRSQARSLGGYVAFLYNHPHFFPTYLPGNTRLEVMPEGHLANAPGSLVGVFAPRQEPFPVRFWKEADLLSHVDPVLVAVQESTSIAARAWVISASGLMRVYPNPDVGHPGSPLGADWDPRRHPAFLAAGDQHPGGYTVWTRPYQDPVGSGWVVTSAMTVRTSAGDFVGVVGLDIRLEHLAGLMEEVSPGPAQYAMLLDQAGRILGAPPAAYRDLGLTPPDLAGEASLPALAESTLGGVRQWAGTRRAAGGLSEFAAAGGGRRHAADATLPGTGWRLVLVQPAGAVDESVAPVQAELDAAWERLVLGWGATLVVVLLLVVLGAARVSAWLTRPVSRLVEGARTLADDLSYRLPPLGNDELGSLAREFNAMADKLESSRAAALAAARLAGEERERSKRDQELAVLAERNRLAQEIHDTIAQGLAGIVLQLEAAKESMETGGQPAVAFHLERASSLARESLQEARQSVWNLRPRRLEDEGLYGALRSLADDLAADGIAVRVELEAGIALPPGVEEALFRVAQESLANVRKHSGATRVQMALKRDNGTVRLVIADNGRGFDPARRRAPGPDGGFGLWAMEERVAAVGGYLQAESRPGGGTRITARLPGGSDGGGEDVAGNQGSDRG